MRIELTIKVTYLPEWGRWEGVRELVQNARDEEVRSGNPMKVEHSNSTLRLFNAGSYLKPRDLLFGQTDKESRNDMAGQFGEGLKLGTLALVRSGCEVRIRIGDQVWTPSIEESRQFGEPVLVFSTRKARKTVDGTEISVVGIPPDDWSEWKRRFLFLSPLGPDEKIGVAYRGDVLVAPLMRGRLFVKGIYVERNGELEFGYDFASATVDRDRRMISTWDLKYNTARMWFSIMKSDRGSHMVRAFYKALTNDSMDVKGFGISYAKALPEGIIGALRALFFEEHGDDAVPVTSTADSRDVRYMGYRGVITSQAMSEVILSPYDGLSGLRKKLSTNIKRKLSWDQLSIQERSVLDGAFEQFSWSGRRVNRDRVDVVEFTDSSTNGMYEGGRIMISRKQLADPSEAIGTLIHEYAHDYGPDGSVEHIQMIERIWRAIHGSIAK